MSALIQEIDRAIERGWANGGHLAVIRELAAVAAPQPQAEPVAWRCTGDEVRCFDGNGCECAMNGNPPPDTPPRPQAEPVAWQTRYRMRNGQWSDWQTRMNHDDAKSNLAFYSSRNTDAQVRGLYPITGADND